jgi:hypothetical protein
MASVSERARQFRQRAEEIRGIASGVADDECRHELMLLAGRYDQMAERLENIERENEST